ncbi:GntR family transcriptional regulator [Nocardia gipuzkoensis]|uniref:GntR family transcriptional regulator n=1 Tax=Nocardia gipuzkoensis TaxID=2749991 RepID=UPI00237ED456|nr:GntR family transcriptional regulator [Nocardia gipuzkoensis]MDE1674353.1 GntR family transcriptional regulator [Nocardia gipuzkoensis]
MALKYERIAGELRQQIQRGDLKPGERLPTEQELVSQFGVSLATIRQALSTLRTEGLISSKHGIGSYVRQPHKMVTRRSERHQVEKDLVKRPEDERRSNGSAENDTGRRTSDFAFSATYTTAVADEGLAKVFDVEPGTPVLARTYRTRFRDEDVPVSLGCSYLLLDMIRANPELLDSRHEPWPGGTMHQLSTVGIEVDRVVEELTTRLPSQEEVEELDLLPGTAVFAIRKTMYDVEGRAVEHSDFILPGDRHRLVYTTKLERWA